MPITPEQFNAMLLRTQKSKLREGPPPDDAVEAEIPLHGEIMKWCKDHNAPYVHANPYKKSRVNPGVTDFVVGYKGRVFWIEVKTRDGKRSTDQLAFAMLLEMQGLKAHVVRSMSEFLELMKT